MPEWVDVDELHRMRDIINRPNLTNSHDFWSARDAQRIITKLIDALLTERIEHQNLEKYIRVSFKEMMSEIAGED